MENSTKDLTKGRFNRVELPAFARRSGVVLGGAVLATTASTSFADQQTQDDINAAYDDGVADLGVAVSGIIGLVAVVVGVGMIISMLRKG